MPNNNDQNTVLVDSLPPNINTYRYLLASIIESSEDAILSMTLDGIVTSWNTAAEKMFGYQAKEIIGKSIQFIYPTNKMFELDEIITKLKKNEYVEHFETERKHKDGHVVDVCLSISSIKNEKGHIIGIAKIIRDISGQKHTSAYARSLIEASLDPLVTISPEGKIMDVNEATIKATGVSRERLIGTDFSIYFTEPEDAHNVYERVFEEGFVTDYPLSIRHSSGKITDVLYNASIYKDNKGNVLGVCAAARDITERKRAEELLHATSAYARSLIEASLDPLVTISPEGKIMDVNEATIKATGVSREWLIGTDFSIYFTEPRKARAVYRLAFKQGSVKDSPLSIRHSSGKITDVLYNASVYKDNKGNVLGVFGGARDATRVKQKDEFTTMVTHELKTPLAPIRGYCKMLKTLMLGSLNSEQLEAVDVIEKNAIRLGALINDIMDARKLDLGKMNFNFDALSIKEFFDNLDSSYKKVLKEKGMEFVVKVDVADIKIMTDKTRLSQVFDNLICNSTKFVSARPPVIEVGINMDHNTMILYVQDNGIGIPLEKQSELFKKFYQIDTSEGRSSGGAGLGLAISKGIIEKLGGIISLESDGKTGTTVYMKFPLPLQRVEA